MLKLQFSQNREKKFKILCLGAHCDDIEIGCGGTLLKLISELKDQVDLFWYTFCSDGQRKQEMLNSSEKFLGQVKRKQVVIKSFRDGFLPYCAAEIKDLFEMLKQEYTPALIFTHYREDRHQDHRTISDLTWNTFRDHLIFEYEIPKYDGDFGTPNFFVELDDVLCQQKIQHIQQSYTSQSNKHWFTDDLFLSVLRLRGLECAAKSRFAEAFYCRKMSM